ncbi:hypothetical protein KUTeg_015792 [Tegillarca granosa]|uniref:Ig-like domain-containing protein n=1 Tax=Tegillarca granosa TaxID=220873 RepID=A0ABQ9ERU6_TEGGR|nr:hypothetical protein KUTeg_015792 [Tegillarca granosa]
MRSIPSFAITWRRNDRVVAIVGSFNCQIYVGTGGQDLYQRYTYNCTSNRSYNLYISATQINSEDGSVWRCGDNDINLGFSGDYTLIVYDPPTTNPVVSGYDGTYRYQDDVVTLTCIVSDPPSNPLVEVLPDSTFPWIEKGNGKLRCSVNDGNPPISYDWSSPNGVIAGQTSNTFSLTSLTKDDNRRGYSCKVFNAYTIAKNLNLLSRTKQLDVEYNPVVTVGISPAYIRETDTFERPCTADGNPPPTISWTSNTSPSNASKFKLVTTMRNQTGDYTCRAQAQSKGPHGLLSGQAVLKVIVQFPPTVQAVLEQTSITEGQTVFMNCLARGVPDMYTYGGWVQEYRNTVIRSVNDFILSKNQQNLTLSGVTHHDIGIYRCKAHNTITDKYGNLFQHGMTNLDIKLDVCSINCIDNNGRYISALIGMFVGVLVEGVVISILYWRKGIFTGINCRPEKELNMTMLIMKQKEMMFTVESIPSEKANVTIKNP